MSGESSTLASHERLINPPVLDLKARHSVFFIFLSDLYFVHVFTFCFLLLIWVWWGAGAARFEAALATFLIFDSFLKTFLLFGGLCLLQASVYKFLLEGRPLWSIFFNPFEHNFYSSNFLTLCGYGVGGFWALVLRALLGF